MGKSARASSSKLRWAKFYWTDWLTDPALSSCCLAAQGLWMRLLCVAAQSEPYGHVTISGKPPTEEQLKRIVAPGVSLRDFRRYLAELEGNGVMDRSHDGAIVSRRMVRDYVEVGEKANMERTRSTRNALRNGASTPETRPRSSSTRARETDADPEADSRGSPYNPLTLQTSRKREASVVSHETAKGRRLNGRG